MVARRLNVPIGKVQGIVVFWLTQAMTVEWRCRECYRSNEKGTVAFELCAELRIPKAMMGGRELMTSGRNLPVSSLNQSMVKKLYLCLPCARSMLSGALDKVEVCERVGPDGFRLFNDI
jgi:hypothetical protein